ncbi:DeoR/GlpR family DNA-binding transcription regulator [Variovorax sp. RA8]|uniref:DeoR/GlpR family DNA-binding transcription regulator n=1 Tax=Variovorax sp. (strain JCM 16519 / RA8) TaxID=662548 RepID=UPI000A89CA90|nr:DeoR/GlpR family DNA-binding transcription regulator [Variovorax sp. RA8]VTU42388.1 Glycerol-3-phosphate regulon repressor [Variovorax sp. RA8]
MPDIKAGEDRVMTVLIPRQLRILDALRRHGPLSIHALAECFAVTEQTIRHDVQVLEAGGQLLRFHGGVRLSTFDVGSTDHRRRDDFDDGSRRIARAVALAVEHGRSLFLSNGPVAHAIAQELVQHRGLRVITNNLYAAITLSCNADCELIVTPGPVRAIDGAIMGDAAIDFICQFKVDVCVIGTFGIDADGTLRGFDSAEARLTRAILAHSREVWLAADFGSFSRTAMFELSALENVNVIFTDRSPPPSFERLLTGARVRLVVT